MYSWLVFFSYLGFLRRCEFYLDRFLMRQPLHQLKLEDMHVVYFSVCLTELWLLVWFEFMIVYQKI
jgi:hypothetical protein